jgi:hypothetical protein
LSVVLFHTRCSLIIIKFRCVHLSSAHRQQICERMCDEGRKCSGHVHKQGLERAPVCRGQKSRPSTGGVHLYLQTYDGCGLAGDLTTLVLLVDVQNNPRRGYAVPCARRACLDHTAVLPLIDAHTLNPSWYVCPVLTTVEWAGNSGKHGGIASLIPCCWSCRWKQYYVRVSDTLGDHHFNYQSLDAHTILRLGSLLDPHQMGGAFF